MRTFFANHSITHHLLIKQTRMWTVNQLIKKSSISKVQKIIRHTWVSRISWWINSLCFGFLSWLFGAIRRIFQDEKMRVSAERKIIAQNRCHYHKQPRLNFLNELYCWTWTFECVCEEKSLLIFREWKKFFILIFPRRRIESGSRRCWRRFICEIYFEIGQIRVNKWCNNRLQ